ncbi:MAG: thioredoxin domain-containing protein [Chloroflexaceae bacterium]|nr:thioredoxin domain-containing protein [Chloroflexaceae bacterium]
MSTAPRRGRKVQVTQQQNSSRILYIVLGVVAIIGAAVTFIVLGGGGNETAATVPTEPIEVAFNVGQTDDGFFYKGVPEAPVTVVDYSDYQCPACANFATSTVAKRIDSEFVETGKVQLIFHDFPLPMHPNGPVASESAYCAGTQGQFWQMHDQIFLTQPEWSPLSNDGARNHFTRLAGGLGLDQTAFSGCLAAGEFRAHVAGAYQAAQAAGIPATPTFIVNGQQVSATQLEAAIQAALAASGQ